MPLKKETAPLTKRRASIAKQPDREIDTKKPYRQQCWQAKDPMTRGLRRQGGAT